MILKHRVVVMYQDLVADKERRETVYPWMTPDEAESFSDKIAQDIAPDPVRYVLIESNKPEVAESCPI